MHEPLKSRIVADPLPHPRQLNIPDPPKFPHSRGLEHRFLLNKLRFINSSDGPTLSTTASMQQQQQQQQHPVAMPKHFTPLSVFPANEVWNCDISNKKDALSAISRAKSPQCKELIHNISCLYSAGKLYNTEIKNQCPYIRFSGRGFERIDYELGTGSLARVVFLLSIHGRAFRQVKRLFKAIYHSDHYYYIHVDSVSITVK